MSRHSIGNYPSKCTEKRWIFRKMGHFGLKSPTIGGKWGNFKKKFLFTQFWYITEVHAKFQLYQRILKFWITETLFILRYFKLETWLHIYKCSYSKDSLNSMIASWNQTLMWLKLCIVSSIMIYAQSLVEIFVP